MKVQFNCEKHFYFKLFSLSSSSNLSIQLGISTDFVYTQLTLKQFYIKQFSLL